MIDFEGQNGFYKRQIYQEGMNFKTLVQLMRASLEGLSEELSKLEKIVNKTVG